MCCQVEIQGCGLQDCSVAEMNPVSYLLSEELLRVEIQVLSASVFVSIVSTLYESLQTIKEIHVGNRLICVFLGCYHV